MFARWSRAIQNVEQTLKEDGKEFMYDDHLGSISKIQSHDPLFDSNLIPILGNVCTCPSNLGFVCFVFILG